MATFDLVELLAVNDRIDDARPVLVAGEKYKAEDEDLFGSGDGKSSIVSDETLGGRKVCCAANHQRMKTSYQANLSLGRIYFNDGRYADALRLLEHVSTARQRGCRATHLDGTRSIGNSLAGLRLSKQRSGQSTWMRKIVKVTINLPAL